MRTVVGYETEEGDYYLDEQIIKALGEPDYRRHDGAERHLVYIGRDTESVLAKLKKVKRLAHESFWLAQVAALRVIYADMEAIQEYLEGDGYVTFAESDESGQTFECCDPEGYDPRGSLDPVSLREGTRERLAKDFPGVTFEYPDNDESPLTGPSIRRRATSRAK